MDSVDQILSGDTFVNVTDSPHDYFLNFTEGELFGLTCVTGISAALSLIGSGVILGTYIFLTGTRSFAFQMVFMLSLCDFVSSFAFLLALGLCLAHKCMIRQLIV